MHGRTRLTHVVDILVIHIDEGPSLYLFHSTIRLLHLHILEYLAFLLFIALELGIFALELGDAVPRRWHFLPSFPDLVPVSVNEEWVLLDFFGTRCTSSQSLTRIPVQQMDNQVLGLW